MNRYAGRLFSPGISDEAFIKILRTASSNLLKGDEISGWLTRWEASSFLIRSSEREKIVSLIGVSFPAVPGRIASAADLTLEHIFNLLGSGPVEVVNRTPSAGKSTSSEYNPIDWHTDFTTGYRWDPSAYCGDKEILSGKAEIKIPWELSRFQHLATLGQAYWLTNDEKYFQEFIDQIDDWIGHNPFGFGVNWASPMEAAIRAVNWILSFSFFLGLREFPPDFLLRFAGSLFLHGRYIRKNLEVAYNGSGERTTFNHYLADIVGLLFLGLFFRDLREGKKWLDFSLKELVREMEFQVHLDGAGFESSIPYHRLALEIFATAALLCRANRIELPRRFRECLEKMFEFTLYYTRPDGEAPQVGDNDNGRLWILSDYGTWDVNDHRYLLSLGAIIFNRLDFKEAAGERYQSVIWLLSRKGWEDFKALKSVEKGNAFKLESRAFPESGYYIMRENDNYMIISAGNVGTNGIGNHKHNDVLSFELCLGRKPVIIDPGTYVYTAEPLMRNLFRSTAFHNILQIDGEEINELVPGNLFLMREMAFPLVTAWRTDEEHDVFTGEFRVREYTLRRSIIFSKGVTSWVITDSVFRGNGENRGSVRGRDNGRVHEFIWRFHFHPAVRVELDSGGSKTIATRDNEVLGLAIVGSPQRAGEGLRMTVERGWFSPSYGRKEEISVLTARLESEIPVTLKWQISRL